MLKSRARAHRHHVHIPGSGTYGNCCLKHLSVVHAGSHYFSWTSPFRVRILLKHLGIGSKASCTLNNCFRSYNILFTGNVITGLDSCYGITV